MGPFCIDCLDIDELGLNNSLLVLVIWTELLRKYKAQQKTPLFSFPPKLYTYVSDFLIDLWLYLHFYRTPLC
jgi:hypothetical protein